MGHTASASQRTGIEKEEERREVLVKGGRGEGGNPVDQAAPVSAVGRLSKNCPKTGLLTAANKPAPTTSQELWGNNKPAGEKIFSSTANLFLFSCALFPVQCFANNNKGQMCFACTTTQINKSKNNNINHSNNKQQQKKCVNLPSLSLGKCDALNQNWDRC